MCFSASPPGVASQDADESVDWFGRRGELCWQSNKGKAANKKTLVDATGTKKNWGDTYLFGYYLYASLYVCISELLMNNAKPLIFVKVGAYYT